MSANPRIAARSMVKRIKKEAGTASRPQSLGEQIYDQLKSDIILCKLTPGQEVTEAGLASAYRLGRAPVRSALARLCQERLLIVVPRRGHVVAPITIKSIQEVFDLRMILEPIAARAATGNVDTHWLRTFGAKPSPPDDWRKSLKFLKDNQAFHLAIIGACGNVRLERILSALYDEMSRMLHLGLFSERDSDVMRIDHEEQEKEHKAIVDALEARDADAVEKAIRLHIQSSHSLVMKAIMNGRLSFTL